MQAYPRLALHSSATCSRRAASLPVRESVTCFYGGDGGTGDDSVTADHVMLETAAVPDACLPMIGSVARGIRPPRAAEVVSGARAGVQRRFAPHAARSDAQSLCQDRCLLRLSAHAAALAAVSVVEALQLTEEFLVSSDECQCSHR